MRQQPPPPGSEPSTDDQDRREVQRLVLVTRPGEHTGERRAFIITLESGKEIILLIPSKMAIELAKMNGYVGRIREATDDDTIHIAELTGRQKAASTKEVPGEQRVGQ